VWLYVISFVVLSMLVSTLVRGSCFKCTKMTSKHMLHDNACKMFAPGVCLNTATLSPKPSTCFPSYSLNTHRYNISSPNRIVLAQWYEPAITSKVHVFRFHISHCAQDWCSDLTDLQLDKEMSGFRSPDEFTLH